MKRTMIVLALASALVLTSAPGIGAAEPLKLQIKDHKFDPAELSVPAGRKFILVVENRDDTAEEFESYSLNREKVIAAHARGNLFLGPLKPGRYDFFGDFHKDTAKGVLVAED